MKQFEQCTSWNQSYNQSKTILISICTWMRMNWVCDYEVIKANQTTINNKQANKQTSKQANKQTIKQANKQMEQQQTTNNKQQINNKQQ